MTNLVNPSLRDPKDGIKQAKMTNKVPPLKGAGGCFFLFVISNPGHVINPLQKRVMTKQIVVIARLQRLHQTGENDKRKNVILNEVKNLCS